MFATKPSLGDSPQAVRMGEAHGASFSDAEASQPGSLPSISLPTGGGSITGSGEKFKVNAASGTESLSMPIVPTAGRAGFGPGLSLNYNTGSGNGTFGLGWDLSVPCITRKTSKGLARYLDAEESDVLLMAGVEDLCPMFQRNDKGEVDSDTGEAVVHTESRAA